MPEISQERLDALTKVEKLANDLWDSKDHGADFRKAVKAIRPETRVPEIDVIEPALAPVRAELAASQAATQAALDRLAAREQQEADRDADGKLNEALTRAQKEFRLTDAGREAVVARMKKLGSTDVEGAAAFIAQSEKPDPVKPTGYAPQSMNLYGIGEKDDKWAAFNKDPIRAFDAEVADIINESQAA